MRGVLAISGRSVFGGDHVWDRRLASAVHYVGLAPKSAFHVEAHRAHSAALHVLLFGAHFLSLVYLVAMNLVAHFVPELFIRHDALRTGRVLVAHVPFVLLYAPVFLGFAACLVQSLRGRAPWLPLASRLAAHPRTASARRITRRIFWGALLLLAVLVARAGNITRTRGAEPAAVYVLYDDGGFPWPRALASMGAYRIATAGTKRWGAGSVVVEPFTVAGFEEALAHGKLVVVWTHGGSGTVWTPTRQYRPEDTRALRRTKGLVYLSGCCTGDRLADWEDALAPSRVIAFDRITHGGDHLYWFFFEAPSCIETLD